MTDDGDLLSRLHLCAEIMDDDVLGIIPECHMLELNCASDLTGIIYGIRPVSLFFLAEEFKYSLGSGCHRLHLIHYLSDLLDRLPYVLDILYERLDVSDTYCAAYTEDASGNGYACISEVAYDPHKRSHHARQEL